MSRRFRYFVMLAEMRTGSNFLEENLRLFPDIASLGELFNPVFIGKANQDSAYGMTVAQRDENPVGLLEAAIASEDGKMTGFRLFHDHDKRAIAHVLNDPDCAKVILTRNPLQSYVSLKIAEETGQWRMNDVRKRKAAKVRFDAAEFGDYLEELQSFQMHVLKTLQTSGQTAFYIHYDDLQDVDILNGLGRFLGSDHQVDELAKNIKPQNPDGLDAKVSNHREMASAIAGIDFMDLGRTPNFEPRRGAGVPGYIAGLTSRLLFIPVRGVAEQAVRDWLYGVESSDHGLAEGMNQKTLRQWKRKNPGHMSFSVVAHPLDRAWRVYADVLGDKENTRFPEIRRVIKNRHDVPFPDQTGDDPAALRDGFLRFLGFLKANLSEQTNVRVDAAWASQSAQLEGAATIGLPRFILDERELSAGLGLVAQSVGVSDPATHSEMPAGLPKAVHDPALDKAARDAYHRDYLNFGFGDWDG